MNEQFYQCCSWDKTRPDTWAKTVRQALLILRSIPSSIRPTPSSIQLTIDEYDNEWNDQKHEFLHLSLALSDLTVEKYDNEWMDKWMNEWMDGWMNEWTSYMNDERNEFLWDFTHFLRFSTRAWPTDQPTNQPTNRPTNRQTEPLIEVLWRT